MITRKDALDKVLSDFVTQSGVSQIVIADKAGLLIANCCIDSSNNEVIAAQSIGCWSMVERYAPIIDGGALQNIHISTKREQAFLCANGKYIVVVLFTDSKIGWIQFHIRELMPKLKEVFRWLV